MRLLATLLHYANSNPGILDRNGFYDLKRRLLERHGQLEGYDIQEVRYECWGRYMEDGCAGDKCQKCGGTGVYQLKYFMLQRWTWSGYVFHRPVRTIDRLPDPTSVTIIGRIEHADYGLAASEAALWLYLLCGEWGLLWRALRSSKYCRPRWWPLLNLQAVVMPTAMFLSWRRCFCGKRFPTWGTGWQVCRKCRNPPLRVYGADDSYPPF